MGLSTSISTANVYPSSLFLGLGLPQPVITDAEITEFCLEASRVTCDGPDPFTRVQSPNGCQLLLEDKLRGEMDIPYGLDKK